MSRPSPSSDRDFPGFAAHCQRRARRASARALRRRAAPHRIVRSALPAGRRGLPRCRAARFGAGRALGFGPWRAGGRARRVGRGGKRRPVMPFTFVATQPHLAATLLAQRGAPVARAAFVHVAPDAWPMLLDVAQAWLASCDAVLLGWVEEAAEGEAHQSDWCLLREPAARGALPVRFSSWLTSA